MPQTRFVLRKALDLDKKVLVVVNKIDRPAARYLSRAVNCLASLTSHRQQLSDQQVPETGRLRRPDYVIDSTFDLFVELGAHDEQVDFPIMYASGVNGTAGPEPDKLAPDLEPLFDMIVKEVCCSASAVQSVCT